MVKHQGREVHIHDIARAAGVSRQAVYLHFPSRADLLIATVRFADETYHIEERLKPVFQASDGVEALEGYINFWGNYIPEIYGLAKALLAVVDSDQAAKAAWEDRMGAIRFGCTCVVNCLAQQGDLAPGWTPAQAVDLMWSLFSIAHWENLTVGCGWSKDQYVHGMKTALKQILVNPGRLQSG